MTIVPALSRLQEEHARFLELFVMHQCGLMALDLKRARLALDLVVHEIAVHAALEDEVLMPIFEASAGAIEGGRPELFHAEHRKLTSLLALLSVALAGLEGQRTVEPREALALVEMGFTFKHLWDHHTKREDAVFYPKLDQLLGGDEHELERSAVWKRLDAADRAARERLGSPPPPYLVDFR